MKTRLEYEHPKTRADKICACIKNKTDLETGKPLQNNLSDALAQGFYAGYLQCRRDEGEAHRRADERRQNKINPNVYLSRNYSKSELNGFLQNNDLFDDEE